MGTLLVERSGGSHLRPGERVTFAVNRVSNRPADFRADPVAMTVPTTWDVVDQRATVPYALSFTAPSTIGDHTIVVDWAPVGNYGNRLTGGEPLVLKMRVAAPEATPVPRDETPPTVAPSLSVPPNDAGWHRAPVTVSWRVADAESGVATSAGCGPTTLTADTGSTALTCSATNGDGFSTSATVSVRLDGTAPTVLASRTLANADGWSNAPVVVSFACTDALSGVVNCADPVVVADEGADQQATGSGADLAGNTSTATLGGINVDLTAPRLRGAPDRAANAAGWYNAPVTVSFECDDALSGVARCTSPRTLAAEGVNQSVAGIAADRAGNPATTLVGGISIDLTAPAVAFAGNAGLYLVNQDIGITCAAADALSGLAASDCPTAVGPAYERPLGTTLLRASATDRAGNQATAMAAFEVRVTYGSLCALTQRFVTKTGVASSLCSKLRAAEAASLRGSTNALAGLMHAYSREVDAQTGKSISAANAAILLRLAAAL